MSQTLFVALLVFLPSLLCQPLPSNPFYPHATVNYGMNFTRFYSGPATAMNHVTSVWYSYISPRTWIAIHNLASSGPRAVVDDIPNTWIYYLYDVSQASLEIPGTTYHFAGYTRLSNGSCSVFHHNATIPSTTRMNYTTTPHTFKGTSLCGMTLSQSCLIWRTESTWMEYVDSLHTYIESGSSTDVLFLEMNGSYVWYESRYGSYSNSAWHDNERNVYHHVWSLADDPPPNDATTLPATCQAINAAVNPDPITAPTSSPTTTSMSTPTDAATSTSAPTTATTTTAPTIDTNPTIMPTSTPTTYPSADPIFIGPGSPLPSNPFYPIETVNYGLNTSRFYDNNHYNAVLYKYIAPRVWESFIILSSAGPRAEVDQIPHTWTYYIYDVPHSSLSVPFTSFHLSIYETVMNGTCTVSRGGALVEAQNRTVTPHVYSGIMSCGMTNNETCHAWTTETTTSSIHSGQTYTSRQSTTALFRLDAGGWTWREMRYASYSNSKWQDMERNIHHRVWRLQDEHPPPEAITLPSACQALNTASNPDPITAPTSLSTTTSAPTLYGSTTPPSSPPTPSNKGNSASSHAVIPYTLTLFLITATIVASVMPIDLVINVI